MSKLNSNKFWPSHEQFMSYVNGSMAPEDVKSFELAIESDGFLSDALEGYQKQSDWIGSISNKVNANITSKYPAGKSGGFKYYYLAGAAILLVVLGVLFVNNFQVTDSEKLADKGVQNSENNSGTENTIAPLDERDDQEEVATSIDANEDVAIMNENIDEIDPDLKENVIDPNVEGNFKEDDEEEIIVNFSNKKNEGNNGNVNSNITARLAIVDVAIGVKDRPNNSKIQKTKIVNGQVVTIDKTANNKQYNQEDLPTYPGGDDALLSEIKGSIKPVVVTIDKKYDRVIGIDFEVSASGVVDAKTLNFMGNPYPQIKDQITKMIQNFPMFNKGKAKGKKGRVRYGIMIKY